MEGQLSRIDGDWENCSEGVFSFLRRDAEQTIFWTVRDVHDDQFSRWTLHIERGGDLQQSVSFVAVNEELQKNHGKPQARGERVLIDAYRTYGRRLHRSVRLPTRLLAAPRRPA